jgi:hypothetical protein
MKPLTEIALEKAAQGVFTRHEVARWVGGSPYRLFNVQRQLFFAISDN